MDLDKRSAWLRKLDEECPYQVVLPRQQLSDDSDIMNFLMSYVGKFDMYVEDDYAAFVRYCFEDPVDAAIFRSRFRAKRRTIEAGGLIRNASITNGSTDFACARYSPVRVEVYASEETVEIFVEADFETLPEERRSFAIINVPRHQFSQATGETARRAAKKRQ